MSCTIVTLCEFVLVVGSEGWVESAVGPKQLLAIKEDKIYNGSWLRIYIIYIKNLELM